MIQTEEWRMLEELFRIKDELPEQAEDFIIQLHEHIDPHTPFSEQLIGLPRSMAKQVTWLNSLYEKYCNDDEDTAEELWDEFYDEWGYQEAV